MFRESFRIYLKHFLNYILNQSIIGLIIFTLCSNNQNNTIFKNIFEQILILSPLDKIIRSQSYKKGIYFTLPGILLKLSTVISLIFLCANVITVIFLRFI